MLYWERVLPNTLCYTGRQPSIPCYVILGESPPYHAMLYWETALPTILYYTGRQPSLPFYDIFGRELALKQSHCKNTPISSHHVAYLENIFHNFYIDNSKLFVFTLSLTGHSEQIMPKIHHRRFYIPETPGTSKYSTEPMTFSHMKASTRRTRWTVDCLHTGIFSVPEKGVTYVKEEQLDTFRSAMFKLSIQLFVASSAWMCALYAGHRTWTDHLNYYLCNAI